MNYYSSFDFWQPFKNIKSILSSQDIPEKVTSQIWSTDGNLPTPALEPRATNVKPARPPPILEHFQGCLPSSRPSGIYSKPTSMTLWKQFLTGKLCARFWGPDLGGSENPKSLGPDG